MKHGGSQSRLGFDWVGGVRNINVTSVVNKRLQETTNNCAQNFGI